LNLAPKAVAPVLLVANRPSARFELSGRPKLICPPVVWSPSEAPNLEARLPRPYHPDNALIPRPPLFPLVSTGSENPYGSANEQVTPLIVTGLAELTDVAPGFGSPSKFWL